MLFNDLDVNKNYFFVTIRYNQKPLDYGLLKVSDNSYKSTNGESYYFAESFDYGWGAENGYILDRIYSFDDLIKLALEESDEVYESNHYGAINFIMKGTSKQTHFVPQLIEFIRKNFVENNNRLTEKNMFYLRELFYGGISDEVLNQDYIAILDRYPKWLDIKEKVLRILSNQVLCI